MTEVAPSDSLRDVYEQRGGAEYGEPVFPDRLLDRKFDVLVDELRRLLPVGALLDAGCGDGRYLAALPGLGPVPERIVGVDIAESILDTARRATSSVFDLVISIQVIENLLDSRAGAVELARVLKPGGMLLLSTDNRANLITRTLNAPRWVVASIVRKRHSRERFRFPHRSFTRRELCRMLVEAGLVVERTRTFRFSVVGASPGVKRVFNRLDRHLPDVGVGDILLVVARRPVP